MKNARIALAALWVVLFLLGCGGRAHRTLYEKEGGFSYDPPPGWRITNFPGLKYKIAAGTPENGFAPNINIVDETYSGSLSDYVELNIQNLKRVLPTSQVLKREDFQTNDALASIRLITERHDANIGKDLRQTFYFFENGSHKFVVTCSALADGGDDLDTLFEQSMKTFHLP